MRATTRSGTQLVLITPPPVKPSEPGLSAGAAAEVLRRMGANAFSIDASIGWHRFALDPGRLATTLREARARGASRNDLTAWQKAVDHLAGGPPALRRRETYADRRVYTSAVSHVEQALRLVASPFPWLRLGIAMIAHTSHRLESSATLAELAVQSGPFDDYFMQELLPLVRASHTTHVALSLTFQQQAPAAFRLAALLREHLPEVKRLLGGPLVACWRAIGQPLSHEPFSWFDCVLGGADEDLAALACMTTGAPQSVQDVARASMQGPLAAAFDEAPWDAYWSPVPTVPAALGRGCYWRRCTFCPDHLHPPHRSCKPDGLERWLHEVARRFPEGAMLHLTDSALPPSYLARVAEVIHRDRLPLQWHGFVRVESGFAAPGFCERLAAGGCVMLQFGVESGSAPVLERMAKGADPARIRNVLRASAEAGIRNHVYLLFGTPRETDEDREQTLSLVEELAAYTHAVNPALLNLPRGSPMHRAAATYGITSLIPFGEHTDLSLYDDFRCGDSHPRSEARRWLAQRFFKNASVRAIAGHLRTPFKANHLCFL